MTHDVAVACCVAFILLAVCFAQAICSTIEIANGTLEFSRNATSQLYYRGTSATIHCKDGTVPNTTLISATCSDQGRWLPWLPYMPACKPPCDELNVTEHLTPTMSNPSRVVGTKVTFSCDPGYSLRGSELITCMENGEWSTKIPLCNMLCQSTNIYGGVVKYSRGGINTHYFPGTTMTYSCNNSYLPSTALTTATCNDQGQWAPWYPATPSCIKQCPKPVLGGNLTAKMSDKSMIVGSTITFNCSSGLVLNGSRLVICTPEGQWSAKVPVCVQAPSSGASIGNSRSTTPFIIVGIIMGVIALVAAVVITGFIVWRVAMYVSKKRAYGQLSVRAHIGDDARVKLFSGDTEEEDEDEDDDKILQMEQEPSTNL